MLKDGHLLLELLLRLMTTGSVLVGATAVYAALRNHSRQLNAQIFLAYSDRLQSLRQSMRSDLISMRSLAVEPGQEIEIPVGAIETLHLIFELYELKVQGYVKNSMWVVWVRDIDRFLSAPTIRQGHEQVRREFEGHRHFIAWIEQRQAELDGRPPHTPR